MSKTFHLPPKPLADPKQPSELFPASEKGYIILLKLLQEILLSHTQGQPFSEFSENISRSMDYFKSHISTEQFNKENVLEEIEKILESIKCDNCQGFNSSTSFTCNHKFCDECIDSLYSRDNIEEVASCLICKSSIYPAEISQEYYELWKEKMHKIHGKCIECGNPCVKREGCQHFCDECLCGKYRKGTLKCETCNSSIKFPAGLNHAETFCSACKINVFLLGDSAKSIHGHVHCFSCLKVALNAKACQVCNNELAENEQREIMNFMFAECGVCKESFELQYFIPKTCCEFAICGMCQAPNTLCVACNTALDQVSLGLVEKFAVLKRLNS